MGCYEAGEGAGWIGSIVGAFLLLWIYLKFKSRNAVGVSVVRSPTHDTGRLEDVSHCLRSPLSIPRRNHCTRCAALPWVFLRPEEALQEDSLVRPRRDKGEVLIHAPVNRDEIVSSWTGLDFRSKPLSTYEERKMSVLDNREADR